MQSLVPRLRPIVPGACLAFVMGVAAGCGRGDTRVNADPGPGYPSQADSGSPSIADRTDAGTQPAKAAADGQATPGLNSAGLPASSSGGTVGGGSGSGTSGTKSGSGLQSAEPSGGEGPTKSNK